MTRQIPACAEALEDRLMMSGSVTAELIGGILTITGDASSNAILINQNVDGQIVVSGMDSGGATLVNGGAMAVFETIRGLDVQMGAGNDRVSVGHSRGYTTTLAGDVTIDTGSGYNEVYIGRWADTTNIHYAGPVIVEGNLEILCGSNGQGSVVLAGLHARRNVTVDLGSGGAEKWFDMEDNIPAYLPHLLGAWDGAPYSRTHIDGRVNVTSGGPGVTHVRCAYSQLGNSLYISTGSGADTFDVLGLDVAGRLRFDTGAGDDQVFIGMPMGLGSPLDPTTLGSLELNTGAGADDVFAAYTIVTWETLIRLGTSAGRQSVHLGDVDYFQTGDLTVVSPGQAWIAIGNSAMVSPLTNVMEDMVLALSNSNDRVDIRNLHVMGTTRVQLAGGADTLDVTDSTFETHALFNGADGHDDLYFGTVLNGQSTTSTGRVYAKGNFVVHGGAGIDVVSLKGVTVEGTTAVDMGSTGARRQRLSLGQDSAAFLSRNLVVAGTGATAVRVGAAGTTLNAQIENALVINLASPGNDLVALQNASVGGVTAIATGRGWDTVLFRNSSMLGRTAVATGAGRDAILAQNSSFVGQSVFHGGAHGDVLGFRRCGFGAGAYFLGARGTDSINDDLEETNTFLGIRELRSIETRWA